MGKHRRRSRSKERKRSKHYRKRSGSRSSSESTSRSRHHGKRRRFRNKYKHKQPRSAEGRYVRGLSASTSRTGASFSAIAHSDVSHEERSSSTSSPGERTPSPRSERSFPVRGGRPPSLPAIRAERPPLPQEVNIVEPPPAATGERSPEGVLIINNDMVLTEDTLQALGEQDQGDERSLDMHPIVKNRWTSILTNGLERAEKSVLLEKHLPPANLARLNAPTLNDEVLKAIPVSTQNKDKFQKNNQNQLGKGLTALGAGMNVLLINDTISKENKNLVLTFLAESGKILSDVHYNMSLTRRALITPTVSKTIGDISKTAPVEELLFGADLSEKIKAAKAIEKSVGDIRQKPETFARIIKKSSTAHAGISKGASFRKNLNVRGPSGFRREPGQQRGRHLQQQGRKMTHQSGRM